MPLVDMKDIEKKHLWLNEKENEKSNRAFEQKTSCLIEYIYFLDVRIIHNSYFGIKIKI